MFDEDKHFTYENLNLFQTIKEKLIILAATKGIARGDAPGELKLKLTKMITAMPTKA